jgi:hypothetical protein
MFSGAEAIDVYRQMRLRDGTPVSAPERAGAPASR